MLREFLLTPDSISDVSDDNAAETLRDLKTCLFPFAATPTALICNLGGNEWISATSRKIATITDPTHRTLAQGLFTKIVDQVSVSRPRTNHKGSDEADWISSGIKSSTSIPLNGIVVSKDSKAPPDPCMPMVAFVSPEHWQKHPNPRLVGRDRTEQEDVLRTFCTHSDWILIRMPQIRGGSDDEIVTVKQIIKLATDLPSGYKKSDIDLHLCNIRNIDQHRLVNGVASELGRFLRQGVNVTLTLWPERHFVNREIIGGDYTRTSENETIRRPRWLMTMTHVAVGSRNANNAGEAGNTWSLFPRDQAFKRLEEIDAMPPIQQVDANALR